MPTAIDRLAPPPGQSPAPASDVPALEPELARQVVEDGIRRWFEERKRRIDWFVDRHFSLRGTLAIHRAALGCDLAKAPANLLLGLPHALLRLTAAIAERTSARRIAAALRGRNLLLSTRVAERIGFLIRTELLELPEPGCQWGSAGDALARIILADPRIATRRDPVLHAIGQRATDPEFRARLEQAMRTYAGTRAAAAEIATGLATLGAGALTLKQLTPGAVSLGPALAAIMAQQAAIASFPLGSTLGGVWYGLFPAAPSLGLTAGLTAGLMLAASGLAAVAGVMTDPLQRGLGLHRGRLLRLLCALERQMLDPAAPCFAVRDHYLARLLDLFDLLGCAARLAGS